MELLELQRMIRESLEDSLPDEYWVRAEIASVQVRTNGHCYLELSQSGDRGVVAKARAVIWRSQYLPLAHYFREATGSELKAGIGIMVRASVSYSELYGLSLVISEIEPQFTMGEAELMRRRTIEKLTEKGKMDQQKELALPPLPYRLAVISAPDAAGYGDFCRHLRENEYGFVFHVDLFEATMQGDKAPASIVDAIGRIEDACAEGEEPYDAVLIMRGGGSPLDLVCFDDYSLCLAIADCPLPVFTAIGHDRDFHVADMVACDYVKTPTAMADLFIDAFAAEDERLSGFGTRLKLAFSSRLSAMELGLDRLRARMLQAAAGKLMLQENRLGRLEERLKAADPRSVLARGYTLAVGTDGVVRKSAKAFREGDRLDLMFPDGVLRCLVEGKS